MSEAMLLRDALAIKDRHAARLMAMRGILGVAVGSATGAAVTGAGFVIRVYVRSARSARSLPAELEGVPVEWRAVGRIVAASDAEATAR